MTNSTKSFFNPHLYHYLGGVPKTYNNPNVLTSPLLQNGAVFFPASSAVAATLHSNAALTSPPPMAIPEAPATFQHGTFYNSPLPSPPLSCSGSPRSSCAMSSTGSPGSSCSVSDLDSIHKNNPQISNPNNFSCLPDVSLIPNIPLQQLVDSFSVPASDNSVSVNIQTSANNSWWQTLPELKSFVSDYLHPVAKPTSSCKVPKSFEDVSQILTPKHFQSSHRQEASQSSPHLQYQTVPSTSQPSCSRPFTNYSLPALNKSRAGPVKPDRRNRTKFSPEQLDRLETEFLKSEFAVADRKDVLARQLGVPARTVALWFQNRRAKHRRDQMKMQTVRELSKSTRYDTMNQTQY